MVSLPFAFTVWVVPPGEWVVSGSCGVASQGERAVMRAIPPARGIPRPLLRGMWMGSRLRFFPDAIRFAFCVVVGSASLRAHLANPVPYGRPYSLDILQAEFSAMHDYVPGPLERGDYLPHPVLRLEVVLKMGPILRNY